MLLLNISEKKQNISNKKIYTRIIKYFLRHYAGFFKQVIPCKSRHNKYNILFTVIGIYINIDYICVIYII